MKCPKCQSENTDSARFCSNCATPLPLDDVQPSFTKTMETPIGELTTGSTFAERYQIIEELGRGGMGRVYKAVDTKLNEKIALKLIRPDIASDEKILERFGNELKLARKVTHKNVGRMFDINEERGTHYITMEYVSGQDLKGLIKQSGKLAIGTAISIAKQICEGLLQAHKAGVVHRDLKPNNIMIDRVGEVRIMDFGIARSIKEKGITGAGVMIGTPEYMSPEQAEAKEIDQQSDIYSLGVILYEMVTGRVPFEGDTALSIAMKHKGEAPKDPKELNANIPDDLSLLILHCLEKDKENRCKSADEALSDLKSIEKGVPTTARPIPGKKTLTSREITLQFNIKKLYLPALLGVAVVIFGLILWKVLPRGKAASALSADKPSLAVVYFMNQTGDEGLDHWREALPTWLITDLSQSKYIHVLPLERILSIHSKLDLLEAISYSSEDLQNMAREGGVDHIFQARYSKAGDIFRIDYSLQRADTLKIIASDYVTGESEESFPSLVDDMTKQIKANLKLSEKQVASDFDKNVSKITTNSPEAFKYYSIGNKYFRQGEHRKGIELLEQAVAIDPEFAMAYRSMAAANSNLLYRQKAKELYQKALEFKDRLSDLERYRIEADFYGRSEQTYDKAIEAYEKLLELYPDEKGARHNLALRYSNIGEFQKSIEQYEILINKYESNFHFTHTNLALVYQNLGLNDKAKNILQAYVNNFPDNIPARRRLAMFYRNQGEHDLASEEMDKAFALAPTNWSTIRGKGDIYYYMGDLEKATAEYQKLLDKEEPTARAWGTLRIGSVFRLQGRFEETIEMVKSGIRQAEELGEKTWIWNRILILAEMDLVINNPKEALKKLDDVWKSVVEDEDLGHQRRILNIRALTYIAMKRFADAQSTAEELKVLIEQGINKNHFRLYFHLIGRLELAKNNYVEAIEFFNQGLPFLSPRTRFRMIYADSIGLAYYNSGELEKAREKYTQIETLPNGKMNYGVIYAKSFYMLGKIYEQQGDTAKSIENYKKFLDLWKDADPGLPEVEDAKKRLAGLK